MDDNVIEFQDTESYGGEKDKKFSHQELVMTSMRKCLETGSKEMREGYYNNKQDKFGNIVKMWVPDARRHFSETVELAIVQMACDMDEEAETNIKKIRDELKEYYEELQKKEKLDFELAAPTTQQHRLKAGVVWSPDGLHSALPYFNMMLDEQVKTYRRILAELVKLTQRLDFYQEEMFEA